MFRSGRANCRFAGGNWFRKCFVRLLAACLILLVASLAFGPLAYRSAVFWHGDGDVLPSSPGGLLRGDGQQWTRIGKPFDPVNLDTLVLSFRLTNASLAPKQRSEQQDTNTESILLFSQSLRGIFNPESQQYVAVTLSSDGSAVLLRLKSADRDSETRHKVPMHPTGESGPSEEWSFVAICPRCQVPIRVVTSRQRMLRSWQRQDLLNSLLLSGDSLIQGTTSRRHFTVDSGLYLGGVIDSWNVAAFESSPKKTFVPFQGQIVSRLYLNGEALDAESHIDDRGPTMEFLRASMTNTLLPVLHQPIHIDDLLVKKTNVTQVRIRHFPMVTAVSDNHAIQLEDTLASLVQQMPERGILIYDIGLSASNRARLQSFCNVAVRQFRSDLFADLVRDRFRYRWKAIIVYSAFREFGAVAWTDASIRYHSNFESLPLYHHGYGFVGFHQTGASPIGAFTHNGTLTTLGVQRSEVAHATMTIGGIHIWLPDSQLPKVVADYWLACSFHRECHSPTGAVVYMQFCRLKERLSGRYIGCHRFDQSVLSVILMKVFHSQQGEEFLCSERDDLSKFLSVMRKPTTQFPRCFRAS